MGKISTGCDIAFIINGNIENPIRMGSDLSYEQVSYKAIAEAILQDKSTQIKLRDALKEYTSIRDISEDDIEKSGIVHNGTVKDLVKKYSYDWSDIDQSTKLLSTKVFRYFGEDMSNTIINQINPSTGVKNKIFILDTTNPDQVENFYNYLKVKSILRKLPTEAKQIIDSSQLSIIIEQLPSIKEQLEKQIVPIEELENKQNKTSKDFKKLEQLIIKRTTLEKLKEFTPKSSIELLYDYLDNTSKYQGISYIVENKAKSINLEIKNVTSLLQGKRIKEATYQDVFANEIVSRAPYLKTKKVSRISKSSFIQALQVKLDDLRLKRKDLKENAQDFKENIKLSKTISTFLDLANKTSKHWSDIINILIENTDDEFSYSLDSIKDDMIYLKNVPRLLEAAHPEITNKSLNLFTSIEQYKGYTIYQSPDGQHYYYNQHIITTKTYNSKRYTNVEDCKNKIDLELRHSSLGSKPLIEFKTRGDKNVIWTPSHFVPGQVVKSLKMPFALNQSLNEVEREMIYTIDLDNSNNLYRFYNHITGLLDSQYRDTSKEVLSTYIDTPEKAVCFLFALNQQEGEYREKLSQQSFQKLIDLFKNPEYEYFLIEKVAEEGINAGNYGFNEYSVIKETQDGTTKVKKKVFKTLITPIPAVEMSSNLLQIDDKTGRPYPSIRLLKDLSQKIKDKLGINIHIETQSTLEDLFKKWNIKIPSEVKGFVKDGEIYINSSNATDEDLFHEYTHIMLGILKARNFENYYELVKIVAESDRGSKLKEIKKQVYKNLADSDLNEEVFADLFAQYMSGKNLDAFLNGTLKSARQAVDKKMGSIFGTEKITEEFYYANPNNIFKQFGYDLGLLMNEGNGLELEAGKSFISASTWIEGQIAKYNEDSSIGIQEICD